MEKKLMLKEKSFKTLMNPTHIEGQIQKRKLNKRASLNISLQIKEVSY